MTSAPTIREVLAALEDAAAAVPGFECVLTPLPFPVQAATAGHRLYLDPDQPVDRAALHLVAAVAALVREHSPPPQRHLRLLVSPRPPATAAFTRSDGIA